MYWWLSPTCLLSDASIWVPSAPRRFEESAARSTFAQPLRGKQRSLDDRLVSGAAAEVACQGIPYLRLGGVKRFVEQLCQRRQHAGRTESALQGMAFVKGLLQHRQLAVRWAEPLN